MCRRVLTGYAVLLLLLFAPPFSACKRTKLIDPFPPKYVGIGLELEIREGYPAVVRVIEGGGASKRGISAGDIIVEIEGESTKGASLAAVVDRLRGKEGTTVTVGLRRRPRGPFSYVTVERAAIQRAATGKEKVDGRSYSAGSGSEQGAEQKR